MKTILPRNAGFLALVAATALALPFITGCREDAVALPPAPETEADGEDSALASIRETINPQDVELLRFVSEGYPRLEGEVQNTSWGSVVRVIVGEDYFSAAGGQCRRATIFADGEKVEIVVKKRGDDDWEIVKNIL